MQENHRATLTRRTLARIDYATISTDMGLYPRDLMLIDIVGDIVYSLLRFTDFDLDDDYPNELFRIVESNGTMDKLNILRDEKGRRIDNFQWIYAEANGLYFVEHLRPDGITDDGSAAEFLSRAPPRVANEILRQLVLSWDIVSSRNIDVEVPGVFSRGQERTNNKIHRVVWPVGSGGSLVALLFDAMNMIGQYKNRETFGLISRVFVAYAAPIYSDYPRRIALGYALPSLNTKILSCNVSSVGIVPIVLSSSWLPLGDDSVADSTAEITRDDYTITDREIWLCDAVDSTKEDIIRQYLYDKIPPRYDTFLLARYVPTPDEEALAMIEGEAFVDDIMNYGNNPRSDLVSLRKLLEGVTWVDDNATDTSLNRNNTRAKIIEAIAAISQEETTIICNIRSPIDDGVVLVDVEVNSTIGCTVCPSICSKNR